MVSAPLRTMTSKPVVLFIHKRNESKLYKYINSQVKISRPGSVASRDTSETNTPYPSSEQQINIQESNERIKAAMNQDGKSRKVCKTKDHNYEEDLKSSFSSVSSRDLMSEEHANSVNRNQISKENMMDYLDNEDVNYENE